MALPEFAKLQFLKIQAFEKITRDGSVKSEFEAMFNPESIQQSFSAAFRKEQALNTTGKLAVFMYNPPDTLSLSLIVDGSRRAALSAYGSLRKENVMQKVKEFHNTAYKYVGTKHEPYHLKIIYGAQFNYDCRLEHYTVNYSDFNNSGNPLRAEINASFVREESDQLRKRNENASSPDLTHSRIVRSGDTLPHLLKEVYGDSSLYMQIARFNDLDDFRNLQAGQKIILPPIDKNS